MKKFTLIVLAALVAVAFAGCGAPATNTTNTANANTSGGPVGPATVEGLKALETKAFEAYKNKDGKFFEGFLTDKFAMSENGQRMDKATTVKTISEHKCDIKSFTFSDEKLTKLGPVTAVITMKVTTDGTCEGQKIPSPVISSSLYVRNGTEWKGAWHGEVPVIDPKAPPAPPTKADDKKAPAPPAKADEKKDANTNTAATKPAADAETDALMAVEKAGWDAWMARDAKRLGDVVTNDISFADAMGATAFGKDACIKAWTEPKCDIKSVSVTDGSSVSVTGDTSILFYKGVANGTCEGQKLGALWGVTIFEKDGPTAWKAGYIFEMPAS